MTRAFDGLNTNEILNHKQMGTVTGQMDGAEESKCIFTGPSTCTDPGSHNPAETPDCNFRSIEVTKKVFILKYSPSYNGEQVMVGLFL